MKNVSINSKCNQCGVCVIKCPQLFAEDESGNIKILSAVAEETDELLSAVKNCPVKAIEVSDGADKKESLDGYIKKLESLKNGLTVTKKDIEFNEVYTRKISAPYVGSSGYNYKSSSQAQNAGFDAFRSTTYSQLDNLILERITDYRVTVVKPYYSKDSDSVYTKNNNEISDILKAVSIIAGSNKLPSDFCTVDVYPDERDIVWKMLQKGEIIGDNFISIVKREFDYSASDYKTWIDYDDMEDYRGKDIYNYNAYDAVKEFENDLTGALKYAKDDVEEATLGYIKGLVDNYNKRLRECIDTKLAALKKI